MMTTQESGAAVQERLAEIPAGSRRLEAVLAVPRDAWGAVVLAHGSGSSRHSPRNQFIARTLQEAGVATLLFNLLEGAEAQDERKIFDIDLLADRVDAGACWLGRSAETRGLPMGYFGASTGAAAALVASVRDHGQVRAIVSRGGRPELARNDLPNVKAPTLFIVGSLDEEIIELNRQILPLMSCPRELVIVAGATHLFPEPGTLEEVARLTCDWFTRHLKPAAVVHAPTGIAR